MTPSAEVDGESRLALLRDARDRLVAAMNGELTCRQCARGVDPPLAGVIRELRAVLTEIEGLDVTEEESLSDVLRDELAAKRARHAATAAG